MGGKRRTTFTDPLHIELIAEGYELDIREFIVDVEKTVRMLKKQRVEFTLPSGIVGQRRKLKELCELHGLEPIYETD
ncbi:hypothetical protein [Mesorhizobium sp. WSM2239]|uniref:Uncharacterized protein n=2 Tax=unclassified Mesorhizobium TaxID=325217 RepID=A0AAU8DGQ1_9HYPH